MIGETKKAIIAVVLAILFVTVIAEVSLQILPVQEELRIAVPEPKPEPSPGDNSTEIIGPERDPPFPPFSVDFSNQRLEVSQGRSVSTNITWSSIYYEEEFTVSFSLKLGAYQNKPVASDYPSPFKAIFEPEPLVLRYQEPKNVILTITADDDASLGLYTMTIYAMDGDKGIGAMLWISVVE